MNGMIGTTLGMPVMEISEKMSMITKQFRFPRSKKKRMKKKWSKNPHNHRTERRSFIRNGTIFADKFTIEKLKETVKEKLT